VALGGDAQLVESIGQKAKPGIPSGTFGGKQAQTGARGSHSFWIVGEKVRREKALDFSGCNSRPGTGSLHPVTIETAAEATKLSELSV